MRLLLILALLVALGYLSLKLISANPRAAQPPGRRSTKIVTEELVRDPVCQLYLPRAEAIERSIRGQELFFCSPACLNKFLVEHG